MKLKSMQKGIVKCRICKEDHWTTQCPYKDTLLPVQEALNKVLKFSISLIMCNFKIHNLICRLKRRKLELCLQLVLQLLDQQEKVVKKAALILLQLSVRVAIEGVKRWPLADEVSVV